MLLIDEYKMYRLDDLIRMAGESDVEIILVGGDRRYEQLECTPNGVRCMKYDASTGTWDKAGLRLDSKMVYVKHHRKSSTGNNVGGNYVAFFRPLTQDEKAHGGVLYTAENLGL